MFQAPRSPAKTYGEEMYKLKNGYGLYQPERPVHLGDVGFLDNNGAVKTLFNILRDGNNQPEGVWAVPEDFRKLELHATMFASPLGPWYASPMPISSESGVGYAVGVGATAAVPVATQFTFNYTSSCGAALVTKSSTFREDIYPNSRPILSYIRHNLDSWYNFAKAQGFNVPEGGLFLVQGCDKTAAWSLAAFSGASSRGLSFDFKLDFPGIASASMMLSGEWYQFPNYVDRRSGPASRMGSALMIPDRDAHDQTVFLRVWKAKRRIIGPPKIVAAAEPEDLRDNDDSSDEASSSIGYVDHPLDVLLDYILEKSNCTVAIANDRDFYRLFKNNVIDTKKSITKILQELSPAVQVSNDGAGSFVEHNTDLAGSFFKHNPTLGGANLLISNFYVYALNGAQGSEPAICNLLEAMLLSPDETASAVKAQIRSLRGQEAQLVVDMLQRMADYLHTMHPERLQLRFSTRCLLIDLSKDSECLPSQLDLNIQVPLEVLTPFNSGGSAEVYNFSINSQRVCIKRSRLHVMQDSVEREKLKRSFCHEAIMARQFHHPNLLQLLGVWRPHILTLCLITPKIEPGNLLDYQRPPFCTRPAQVDPLPLLVQVMDGVSYLHQEGFVHGDIKAANVLVDVSHHVFLCDYDCATFTDSDTIQDNNDKGAYTRMAPEFLHPLHFGLSERVRTRATDIYACGLLFLEAYTMSDPFPAEEFLGLVHRVIILQRRPHQPTVQQCHGRILPPELWQLIERCWSDRPSDRPNTEDVQNYLKALLL